MKNFAVRSLFHKKISLLLTRTQLEAAHTIALRRIPLASRLHHKPRRKGARIPPVPSAFFSLTDAWIPLNEVLYMGIPSIQLADTQSAYNYIPFPIIMNQKSPAIIYLMAYLVAETCNMALMFKYLHWSKYYVYTNIINEHDHQLHRYISVLRKPLLSHKKQKRRETLKEYLYKQEIMSTRISDRKLFVKRINRLSHITSYKPKIRKMFNHDSILTMLFHSYFGKKVDNAIRYDVSDIRRGVLGHTSEILSSISDLVSKAKLTKRLFKRYKKRKLYKIRRTRKIHSIRIRRLLRVIRRKRRLRRCYLKILKKYRRKRRKFLRLRRFRLRISSRRKARKAAFTSFRKALARLKHYLLKRSKRTPYHKKILKALSTVNKKKRNRKLYTKTLKKIKHKVKVLDKKRKQKGKKRRKYKYKLRKRDTRLLKIMLKRYIALRSKYNRRLYLRYKHRYLNKSLIKRKSSKYNTRVIRLKRKTRRKIVKRIIKGVHHFRYAYKHNIFKKRILPQIDIAKNAVYRLNSKLSKMVTTLLEASSTYVKRANTQLTEILRVKLFTMLSSVIQKLPVKRIKRNKHLSRVYRKFKHNRKISKRYSKLHKIKKRKAKTSRNKAKTKKLHKKIFVSKRKRSKKKRKIITTQTKEN